MKTILASVYAVNPYKGSEDGTGWNLLLQIARFNKVIAVTRENNRKDIERYLAGHEVPYAGNIQFEYYDLPYWMRWWKRGGKNALLYYYMWQAGMPRFVRRRQLCFDIVHNLNFHSDWTPSFLWRLRRPMVWGPIGHHPKIPKSFIAPVYGRKKWLLDRLKWQAKQFFWHFDPFVRITAKKAVRVLAVNSEVQTCLPVDPAKLILMPAVATEDIGGTHTHQREFQIISVGRFVPLKGFDITIRAFAAFLDRLTMIEKYRTRLVLVGDGPELPLLQQLIDDLHLGSHVFIQRWVERSAMKDLYAASSVFFFPSHEGAGMVVPEALCCGLPILCFDNAGPGAFVTAECGIRVSYSSYDQVIEDFSAALFRLHTDGALHEKLSAGARVQYAERYQWDLKGEILKQVYDEIQ